MGGLSPFNNLLKFVNFVIERDCESQAHENEDSNLFIFEEATRINQAITFDIKGKSYICGQLSRIECTKFYVSFWLSIQVDFTLTIQFQDL